MQGLRKTAICVTQVASCGVRSFNANPSNPVIRLKCVRGFKSAVNPEKKSQFSNTTLSVSEESNSILFQHYHGKSSNWSYRCNQGVKSVSSLNKEPPKSLDEKTSDSLTTKNILSWISKDNFNSSLKILHGLPLLNSSALSQNLVNVSTSGIFQCRYISNFKGRHQRKRESRTLSTQQKKENSLSTDNPKEDQEKSEEKEEDKPTLYQRFKKTYKEHGKVLVAVHVATSAVWFGTFYAAARCGIDIVPYLESWNFSERVISPFQSGGLGDIALAYLLYKLATPARYTVTIGGTNLAIRYLRKEGRMEPVPEGDRLRELYKEGRDDLKIRSQHRINNMKRIHSRIPRRRNRNHTHHHKEHKETKGPKG